MFRNDFTIIQDVLSGKELAFEEIIKKYEKKIYGFIYKMVREECSAEDLTQEVFIKVYQNIESFDMNKTFVTWLYTIAKNTTFNYLKKSNRVKFTQIHENMDYTMKGDLKINENPEALYEEKEKLVYLYRIIHRLPLKYRELILLKYVEKLSYKKISEQLNISVTTVESRLYKARQKLIKAIDKDGKNREQVKNVCFADSTQSLFLFMQMEK